MGSGLFGRVQNRKDPTIYKGLGRFLPFHGDVHIPVLQVQQYHGDLVELAIEYKGRDPSFIQARSLQHYSTSGTFTEDKKSDTKIRNFTWKRKKSKLCDRRKKWKHHLLAGTP